MISSIISSSSNQIQIHPIQDIDTAAIDQRIEAHFPKDLPGGLTIVVMKEGEILFQRSLGDHAAHGLDTRQQFASITKEFTGACIVDLVKTGKLRYDQNIRDILPDLPEFTHLGKRVIITVDHLVQLQSGLPECSSIGFMQGKDFQDLNQDEVIDFLKPGETLELFEQPGAQFKYCNTNFYLLSKIIKACSGTDLRTYANDHIFKPFRMNSTDFINQDSQFVPGYTGNEETTSRNKTWGPCGIVGTSADMVKWDAQWPNSYLRDDLLSHPQNSVYGRGLFVTEYDGNRYINHTGDIEGYTNTYLRVESLDGNRQIFSIFIAANQTLDVNVTSLANSVTNILLNEKDEAAPEMPSPKVSYDIPAMRSREGAYHCGKIQTTHLLELIEHEGKPALKMAPSNAANPQRSSQYFAPLFDNPTKYVEVPGGSAEIEFNPAGGFTYTDPNACLKLEFDGNRPNQPQKITPLPLGHAIF